MEKDVLKELKKIYRPDKYSHKGQNGRLLIIGGSRLFHAASFWALKVASRIVDLVHYSSIPENNQIVTKLKEEFRDGIVVPRAEIESYIEEDDCILIGPGMVRSEISNLKSPASPAGRQNSKLKLKVKNLEEINQIEDEGIQTYYLTKYLLTKYRQKRWVIDAGALQMMEVEDIPPNAILTPHRGEFEMLKLKTQNSKLPASAGSRKRRDKTTAQNLKIQEQAKVFAQEYNCLVLLKGEEDIISDGQQIKLIKGGNAGMTKGGTGDVLAGLAAALYCKNDAFLAATAASFINKKGGEDLYKTMGYWFNASDLADQIPRTMKSLFD